MCSRRPADIALRAILNTHTGDEFGPALTEWMTANAEGHVKNVTEVRVVDLDMNDAGAAALADALPRFPKLRVLAIGDNEGLTAVGAGALIGILAHLASLEVLMIRDGSSIGPAGAAGIAASLPAGLKELVFIGGGIGNVGCVALAAALPRLTQLEKLVLRDNFFDATGADALATALGGCSGVLGDKLQVFSVGHNPIGSAGVVAITTKLVDYPQLRNVNFGHCDVGDEGARAVAGLLTSGKVSRLEAVSVSGNPIHDEGALALAAAVPSIKALKHFDADGCEFWVANGAAAHDLERVLPQRRWIHAADEALQEASASKPSTLAPLSRAANNAIDHALSGVGSFADAVRHFMEERPAVAAEITEMTVYDSTMDDEGAIALSEMLPELPKLTRFTIGRNTKLGMEGIAALIGCLPRLTALESLIIVDGENIGPAGGAAIASVLPSLPKLKEFVFVGGGLGAGGAAGLAAALPTMPKLETLKLACNKFGDEGTAIIGGALAQVLPKLSSFTFRA